MKELTCKMMAYCRYPMLPRKAIDFLKNDRKLMAKFPEYKKDDIRFVADVILMQLFGGKRK